MRCSIVHASTILGIALSIATAPADTTFNGGNINSATSWSDGLPAAGNPATIATDGSNSTTVFGYGGGTIVNHSAGTITSSDGFNFIQGDIWNLSGGEIVTRYFLSNGQQGPTVFNLSAGRVVLADVPGNQHMGAGNNGSFNVSGSVSLDGTNATLPVQTGGTVNIASGWSGMWTWGIYAGDDWKNLFTSNLITVDGANIDAAIFDAMFVVTEEGKTLSMVNSSPTFAITEIEYSPAAGNMITLSWDTTAGTTYTVYFSTDPGKLQEGGGGDGDVGDSFEDNDDGGVDLAPEEGKITIDFANPIPEARELFFSAHKN